MTGLRKLGSVSALAFLMTTTATLADVTAQQVWTDWQDYITDYGYTLTGSESTSGDTLTVSDTIMRMELPEGEGTVEMQVGDIHLRNLGDGRVSVDFAETMPMTANMTPKAGAAVQLGLSYLLDDFEMIVSGDATQMAYTYSADAVTFRLDRFTADGETVTINKAEATMADLDGLSTMTTGNIRNMTQRLSAQSMAYDVDMVLPEAEGGAFKVSGGLNTLTFAGEGSYPNAFDTTDLSKMLAAGFAFTGDFAYADGQSAVKITEPGEKTIDMTSQSATGRLSVAMDADGLRYAGGSTGGKTTALSSDFPLPIEVAFNAFDFALAMPSTPGDEARDAALRVGLSDLTMSEMLWGLFDPTGKLPRDPATLLVDVSSKVKLFADIFNPEAMKGFTGPVGEPESLTINALRLDVAGAELTGSGDFTFDKTDTSSFPGTPAPEGSVDLKLTGANALIDNLIEIGLLPADKAMGARMMMGLFAVPGDGEDTLKSKIEVNDQGHVLANGQRLK